MVDLTKYACLLALFFLGCLQIGMEAFFLNFLFQGKPLICSYFLIYSFFSAITK